jgi:hypothetical protein
VGNIRCCLGLAAGIDDLEQDLADLERHEAEMAAGRSFNYALFDAAETALLGCVYIDPPDRVGTSLERALDQLVPEWITTAGPFRQPRYLGHDISWAEWLALPDLT